MSFKYEEQQLLQQQKTKSAKDLKNAGGKDPTKPESGI